MRLLSHRTSRAFVPQHAARCTPPKRSSCLTCNAKSSSNSPWKIELAELNEAIKKSCDEEQVWEAADEVVTETESLNLIADQERVFLVGIQVKSERPEGDTFTVDESLSELASLSRTAGLAVVGSASQALANPNPSTYLGSGKLAAVASQVHELAVDTVIVDDEISPGQQRNLEKALGAGVRVADRTALILDIFAQRARTKEGKLQVDLAAADYQLPRLQRMWTHLDRQSGGGQVKGMGEKQKEVDKRLLRDKMAILRKEIEAVRAHRSSQRKRRRVARMPSVALIGYTNAGKSTLLNSLTAAGVLAEDSLFATLDPTVRRIVLPTGKLALLSDTVGFIQKLPTQLVDAFRATLEEIKEADVLVHVVDVSHPQASKQAEAVFRILEELQVSDELPMVTAWNKLDAHANPDIVRSVASTRPDTVAVSGSSGEGVEDLIVTVEAALEEAMVQFEALVPYSEGHIINQVREEGVVRLEKYTADGVQLAASADLATVAALQPHITEFTPRERVFEWRQEQALSSDQ